MRGTARIGEGLMFGHYEGTVLVWGSAMAAVNAGHGVEIVDNVVLYRNESSRLARPVECITTLPQARTALALCEITGYMIDLNRDVWAESPSVVFDFVRNSPFTYRGSPSRMKPAPEPDPEQSDATVYADDMLVNGFVAPDNTMPQRRGAPGVLMKELWDGKNTFIAVRISSQPMGLMANITRLHADGNDLVFRDWNTTAGALLEWLYNIGQAEMIRSVLKKLPEHTVIRWSTALL